MGRKRKPLEQWQLEDAKKLRALWNSRNRNAKISQATAAAEWEIGTQGLFWQYLSGTIPLNIEVAKKFAEGLECNVDDFSPTLAQKGQEIGYYYLRQLRPPKRKSG